MRSQHQDVEGRQLAREFHDSLTRLLEFYGERLSERSRVVVDARPGMLWLGEVQLDGGEYRPVLVLEMDTREPKTFGRVLVVGE